ncbi:MAG: hypothetical protein HKN70_13660 [Gammaproteobacteria bacterium]|nr:hypothetical protein [Gammaproteobacteria bacterium]
MPLTWWPIIILMRMLAMRRDDKMTDNPYQSPDANVDKTADQKRRPIRAILISFVVDVGGTFLGIAVMAIIYVGILTYSGKTRSEIDHLLSTSDPTTLFNILVALWGVLMSFIGGFICVRIARARDYNYPIVLASLVFIFGIVTSWAALEIYEILLWSTLSFGATMLGAQRALGSQLASTPEEY